MGGRELTTRVKTQPPVQSKGGFLTKLGLLGPPGQPLCISRKEVGK